MIDIIIPIFAAFSHLIFVTNFVLINRESLKCLDSTLNIAIPIFIAGHLIIIANLSRHSITLLRHPKTLLKPFDETTRNYGILGHALLAISIIMQILIYRNMDFNIYRVLFIIGQIGMMLLYYLAYQINNRNNINNITIDIKSLYFIIPALIIFYIREAIIATTNWQKIVAIIMTIVYIDWIIYISTLV